VIHLYYFI